MAYVRESEFKQVQLDDTKAPDTGNQKALDSLFNGNAQEKIDNQSLVDAPDGVRLIRGQFKSSNYVPLSGGWKLSGDGGLEFNASNLTIVSGKSNSARVVVGATPNQGGINSAAISSDIVFWSGTTYANRATAAFRVDAAGNLTATSATLSGVLVATQGTFGGDGSDGALSIAAGTTTINLGAASEVVKNYSSISITGTGALAFSNPNANGTIVILKSQGAVTITSSATSAIDVSGMGAAGGLAGIGSAGGNGTKGYSIIDAGLDAGQGGAQGPAGNSSVAGGVGGIALTSTTFYTPVFGSISRKCIFLACGSGGAGGGSGRNDSGGSNNGGAGGNGGGALYIECAGALNFTGTINISGLNGSNAPNATSDAAGGGGGGGACGMCAIVYQTLTANTGTFTAVGGNGGTGGNGTTTNNNSGASGGGGGGFTAAGGQGGSGGAIANNGGGGASGGAGAGGGGGGGGGGIAAGSTNGGGAGSGGTATNATLVVKNTAFG